MLGYGPHTSRPYPPAASWRRGRPPSLHGSQRRSPARELHCIFSSCALHRTRPLLQGSCPRSSEPCRPPARERLFSAADKRLLPATEKPPHNDILSAKIPPEPLQRLPTYAPRQTLALSFAGKLHRCFFHISFPAAAHAPWPALCHVRRPARHDAS